MKKERQTIHVLTNKNLSKGKTYLDQLVRDRIEPYFSPAQIEVILGNCGYSRKWSNRDYANGMMIKIISPKALNFVRVNRMIPLPSNRTLQRKFRFVHCCEGFIEPSMVYLERLVPRLKSGDEAAILEFDEMKLSEIAGTFMFN